MHGAGRGAGMSVGNAVKVSVVVPVYNPGRYLDDLLVSLARQTMPPTDFEVVFVDDGSTDGTSALLCDVAAAAANVRVLRIPNSGWPGRPRNLGIDEARGDYVFFVDHDDELGDDALERMYAYAVANDSDVVVGREVRRGKGWVAGPLFRQDLPATTLAETPELLLLLTPHKLFRRRLLVEHGIRFLEGPRRLEDHPFVMAAYFRARVISVLASTTCYYWHNRPDSAGSRARDWHLYFTSMHDAIDVVEAHTEPGPLRDRMLLHWYRDKGLRRLGTQLAVAPPLEAAQLTRRAPGPHAGALPGVPGRPAHRAGEGARCAAAGRRRPGDRGPRRVGGRPGAPPVDRAVLGVRRSADGGGRRAPGGQGRRAGDGAAPCRALVVDATGGPCRPARGRLLGRVARPDRRAAPGECLGARPSTGGRGGRAAAHRDPPAGPVRSGHPGCGRPRHRHPRPTPRPGAGGAATGAVGPRGGVACVRPAGPPPPRRATGRGPGPRPVSAPARRRRAAWADPAGRPPDPGHRPDPT